MGNMEKCIYDIASCDEVDKETFQLQSSAVKKPGQYNMMLHALLKWRMQNINHSLKYT